ncbi:hypothetical protein AU210_016359 [Fusarium oxysporum f. sp. radicis-cucumerinum]|uniref:Uncharacterized protein n=1 Tax=Fusarium oxysporum f. sp. radicis-cucumerinum TaxID=327505 RepID=A0A2H3G2Q9_FUSOX|nr:hypothetical protein AU210_016359 [Fusarium oxysporum f. sp. radicis-cucumerinum]
MCNYESQHEIAAQIKRDAVVDKLGLPHLVPWEITQFDETPDYDYWLVSDFRYEEWKNGKLSHEKDILSVVGSSDAETTHSAKAVFWLRHKWLGDKKPESLVFYLDRVYFGDGPSTVALKAAFQQLIYQDLQVLQHAYDQENLEPQWLKEKIAGAFSGKVVYIMTDGLDASEVLKIPNWLQPQSSTPSSRPSASFKFLIHLEKKRVLDSGDVLTGCTTIDLDTDTPQPRIRETYIELTPVEEGSFILRPYAPPNHKSDSRLTIEAPEKAQQYLDQLMSQPTLGG